MKWCLVILIVSFLTGCMNTNQNIEEIPSQKSRLANEIKQKVCLQLKKEKNLYPCGSGGEMIREINMLHLAFDYYKPIEIEEARELLITAANLFLNSINSEERIHKYLVKYPFPPENIEMGIYIYTPNGSNIPTGQLCIAAIRDGKLKYKIIDPNTNHLETIFQESYEEARLKLTEIKL